MQDLEARLGVLPAQSMVYYLVVDRDGANRNINPLDYVSRVAAVSNVPVYSWVDSTMDRGVVGGNLKNQLTQVRAVAALALRVLRGEPADTIPPSSIDLNVPQVDWRQLQRWGLSESRVPAGTLVRFKETSVWARYRGYVFVGLALIVAQSGLIAALLIQRTRRRRAEAQVRGSRAELVVSSERIRDLGARLLNAQERERAYIARELHDDISQQLAMLKVDLSILSASLPGSTQRAVATALRRAGDVARAVHELSHRLHPTRLRLFGLTAALQALHEELSTSGIAMRFTLGSVPDTLSPDVQVALFRVVQEALQNTLKHSQARNVSVTLSTNDQELTLAIEDDGVGFDVDAAWARGLGVISMRERIEAIGGSFAIHSALRAGTRLEIRAPLHAEARPESPLRETVGPAA
jgi:signal transduction histidine kinase